MMSPMENELTDVAPTNISNAVELGSAAIAASGVPPEGCAATLGSDASTFICSEPPAKAICNFPHSRKSNSTRASSIPRNCAAAAPLTPARRGSAGVRLSLAKLSTHPRSSHGGGGESSWKAPSFPGSKMAGASVARFTGAK